VGEDKMATEDIFQAVHDEHSTLLSKTPTIHQGQQRDTARNTRHINRAVRAGNDITGQEFRFMGVINGFIHRHGRVGSVPG